MAGSQWRSRDSASDVFTPWCEGSHQASELLLVSKTSGGRWVNPESICLLNVLKRRASLQFRANACPASWPVAASHQGQSTQVLVPPSCVQSEKKSHVTQKPSKNHPSHWTGRADTCVLSPRGGALYPHHLWNRLLPRTASPKSSRSRGERPEIFQGHHCPVEMN